MTGLELEEANGLFSRALTAAEAAWSPDEVAAMEPERIAEIVQASMDGWTVFIETGLQSEFYQEAQERIGRERAARATLMYLYLSTFPGYERKRLEEDVDYFLFYAMGFLRELFIPVDARPEFRQVSRLVFFRAMRRIFQEGLSAARGCGPSDAHVFMRSMLRISSSASGIIDAWDDYKEYMYRFFPQLHQIVQ